MTQTPALSDMAAQARRLKRRKQNVQAAIEALAAPTLAALMLAAWQLAVPYFGISAFILPTPYDIALRIVNNFPLLMTHALTTALETLAGFFIAAVTGIVTAFAIFYSRIFERAFYPLLVAMQTVPKVALAPLLVLYLGYGFAPKCFLAFLLAYFPVVISTVIGLQALDKAMVDLVRSMGATEWQTFFKIRLHAALPNIFGGLKVAISLAVIGSVIGEYVASEQGLGYLQLQASAKFDTSLSFAALVLIALMGVITFWLVEVCERRAVYQREKAN